MLIFRKIPLFRVVYLHYQRQILTQGIQISYQKLFSWVYLSLIVEIARAIFISRLIAPRSEANQCLLFARSLRLSPSSDRCRLGIHCFVRDFIRLAPKNFISSKLIVFVAFSYLSTSFLRSRGSFRNLRIRFPPNSSKIVFFVESSGQKAQLSVTARPAKRKAGKSCFGTRPSRSQRGPFK